MYVYWPDASFYFLFLLYFDPHSMTSTTSSGTQNKGFTMLEKNTVLHYMALQRHSGGALNLNVNLSLASLVEPQTVFTGEASEKMF